MFFLRIHTVDTDHPLTFGNAEFIPCGTKASSYRADRNSKFSERRGVIHLFRTIARSSLPNPSSRSTVLFFVAVPNSFSYDDSIRFCGFHVDHVAELLFIRNDGIEDPYSVLVQLVDQGSADGFHCSLNGKRFSPAEAELCHILFLLSVEYTESSEIAGTPPAGCTELPTCPVCLERLDPDTSGILSTLCDHSFQCPCMSKWNHLSCQVCRFCQQQDDKPTCSACGTKKKLWVCVICGFVGCGRYRKGHAIMHWKDTQHCYSLGLRTQQIWDYVGDNYVHRLNQSKVDASPVQSSSPIQLAPLLPIAPPVQVSSSFPSHAPATPQTYQRRTFISEAQFNEFLTRLDSFGTALSSVQTQCSDLKSCIDNMGTTLCSVQSQIEQSVDAKLEKNKLDMSIALDTGLGSLSQKMAADRRIVVRELESLRSSVEALNPEPEPEPSSSVSVTEACYEDLFLPFSRPAVAEDVRFLSLDLQQAELAVSIPVVSHADPSVEPPPCKDMVVYNKPSPPPAPCQAMVVYQPPLPHDITSLQALVAAYFSPHLEGHS